MRDPLPVRELVPRQRRLRRAGELRQDLERLAVVVQVDQKREFRRANRVDLRFRPRAAAFAWIPEPDDPPCEVRDLHDVGIAVAVDVHRQIAEVVDVAAVERNVADLVPGPGRRLVPVFGREDVEAPVAVEVGDRNALAETRIDHLDAERDIGGTARLGSRLTGQVQERDDEHHHDYETCLGARSLMPRRLTLTSSRSGGFGDAGRT
jgi:hypothetical protein